MNHSPSLAKATSDLGATFATAGERGLMLFSLVLVIFLLLIFIFAMARLVMRSFDRQAAANEKLANALFGLTVQVSRTEMAVGVQEAMRAIEKGTIDAGKSLP